ncbi:MAG: hydroxylase, partial [Mycobacterium sp.]|nr:hydroxylase [Mycobacterium sp.]
PFGSGRTSPVAASDVADVITAVLVAPAEHLGAVYELTGPATLSVDELAERYSQALGRPVTGLRPPDDEWLRELAALGMPPHVEQHIATMARLHREDRYNRSTDDVERITGRPAETVRHYVERHRELFG